MATKENIQLLIQKYKPDLIETIKKLVRAYSVGQIDGYEMVRNQIVKSANSLDIPVSTIDGSGDEDTSIFVGENFNDKKGILLFTDFSSVEFPVFGNKNPYLPYIKDDKLYGAAAWKNKGTVALILYAMKILKDLGHPGLVKALFADYASSKLYSGFLNALEKGLQAEAVANCGPSEIDDGKLLVYYGCRGMFKFKVHVHGDSVHTGSFEWARKDKGASAFDGFNAFWSEVQKLIPDTREPDFGDYPTNTLTLLGLNGGSEHSVVPKIASAVIELRTGFEFKHDNFYANVQKIAKQIEKTSSLKFEFEIMEDIQGVKLNETKLSRAHEKFVKEYFDYPIEKVITNYLDPNIYFIDHGLTNLNYITLSLGDNPQTEDEYIDLSTIDKWLEILVLCILEERSVEIS